MNRHNTLAVLLVFVFIITAQSLPAYGDSPVTSTAFSLDYLDQPMVRQTLAANGVISDQISLYLASPEPGPELKAAVINGLYSGANVWDVRDNAYRFAMLIHGRPPAGLDPEELDADELLVIGYLTLLDDYFNPADALAWLSRARTLAPRSFTIAIVEALAQAQTALFESDWPSVWQSVKTVAGDPELTEDRLKPQALQTILEYLVLYRSPEDDVLVNLDRQILVFRTDPVIRRDRTLVPWQELAAALEVQSTVSGSKLTLTGNGTTIILDPAHNRATLNGRLVTLDQTSVVLGNQLMIPLRFTAESFGAAVHWDSPARKVEVSLSRETDGTD